MISVRLTEAGPGLFLAQHLLDGHSQWIGSLFAGFDQAGSRSRNPERPAQTERAWLNNTSHPGQAALRTPQEHP